MQFPTLEIRSNTTVEEIKKIIDEAIKKGSSISIFAHHVVESNPDIYSTTISNFKEIVDYAALKRDQGLIDIVTMTEFYEGLADKSRAYR